MGVVLGEASHHRPLERYAVAVRHHHRYQRLDILRQSHCQRIELGAGIENRLDMAQHLPARLIERGVAAIAVKQRAADIGLEIGDGDADSGLAFAQLARRRRKRTE
ncbi:hypothetical protein D3C79_815860 [compost metagenome]